MRFTAIVFVLVAVLALASAEEGIFKISEYQNCTCFCIFTTSLCQSTLNLNLPWSLLRQPLPTQPLAIIYASYILRSHMRNMSAQYVVLQLGYLRYICDVTLGL